MTTKKNFNQFAINKIKNENRNHLISKLKTGDIIKITAKSNPLIFHYGIIELNSEGLFIIHTHPDKVNAKGGNTVREPFEKLMKGRSIISVEKTNLKKEDLDKLYQELEKYKYDIVNFNCEHFINFAKNKNYVSPQILRWTSIGLIGLAIFFYLKNKKV